MDAAFWEKAKDLIADALERPPSERDAFLKTHCADPMMLAEIQTLLEAYEAAPDFLEQPPRLGDDDDVDDLPPGSRIGPYIVVDRLGRGGMGEVFLGRDPRLRRKVALKRLLSSRIDRLDERSRILREARAAAGVSHPNVATVHDVIEDGTHVFIVMEYVEGESLAARLRRERLGIDRVVTIGRQLASALGAAHATGVIHGDLKPANIQLAIDGSPKVLDFGLARAMATFSNSAIPATTAGMADELFAAAQPGTPGYMAPEQMMGRLADERSDIFSAGVVLFEMATGHRPYAGAGAMELLGAMASPAPRADAVDPQVPGDVADVIAKTLELDPRQRFQTAGELESALEPLQHEIESHTRIGVARLVRPSIRTRVLRMVELIVLVVIVLAILGLTNTAAFNLMLQRPASFAKEPPYAYILWGFRSNVALLVCILLAAILVPACKFLLRMVSLFEPLDRGLRRFRQTRDRAVATLGLNDPIVLAQGLALIGAVAVGSVIWSYFDLFEAFTSRISVVDREQLLPLAPGNQTEKALYRIVVNVLLLAFGLSLFRIVQLRARRRIRHGVGAVVVGGAILVLIVLLHEFPYRTMWKNEFERIDVGGARCYFIGADGDEWLVHCPEAPAPRNRVVRHDDPTVRRLGIVESIFTPSSLPASGSSSRRTP